MIEWYIEMFKSLGIDPLDYGLYLKILEYQMQQMSYITWAEILSSLLWIGTMMGFAHRLVYGVRNKTRYYLERG